MLFPQAWVPLVIIVGATGLTFTREQGAFFCPACMDESSYRRKSVRRFLTIYFIPLVPLEQLGEYVECQRCRGNFEVDVLQLDRESFVSAMQEQFYLDLMRAMVLMAVARGAVDDLALDALEDFLVEAGGQPPGREQLREEIRLAQQAQIDCVGYVRSIAPQLGGRGKELLIRGVFEVASATGQLHDAQRLQLERLPEALGISEEQFRAVIAGADEEALEG